MMADLSDVENALVSEISNALYPYGVSQPSIAGTACRVYRGWPLPAALDSDLASGIVNVTVFPATKSDEVLDPYLFSLEAKTRTIDLTAAVTGQCITLSGQVVNNLLVGVLVDGVPFSYSSIEGDTTESIAANLVALISADRIAILRGPMLTIPGARKLAVRVVANATVAEGLRRQRREIQVSFWCLSSALRDLVCKRVDLALTESSFIALADETKAHVHYKSTQTYDQSQKALLFRRDLCYCFDFITISNTIAPAMLFGKLVDNGADSCL